MALYLDGNDYALFSSPDLKEWTRLCDVELPDDESALPAWRRKLLGLPEDPVASGPYDLVVVGGGYGGLGSAISAARMGCKGALVQNRPLLGGNGSSEIMVPPIRSLPP